jgi:hypothetical protein
MRWISGRRASLPNLGMYESLLNQTPAICLEKGNTSMARESRAVDYDVNGFKNRYSAVEAGEAGGSVDRMRGDWAVDSIHWIVIWSCCG